MAVRIYQNMSRVGMAGQMLQYVFAVCCLMTVVICESQNHSEQVPRITYIQKCPNRSELKVFHQVNSSCKDCFFCDHSHQYKNVVCPTLKQLLNCSHELFVKNWVWQPNFAGNVDSSGMVVMTTKPPDKAAQAAVVSWNHYSHLLVLVGCILFVAVVILVVPALIYYYRRSIKKRHRTNYDAIRASARRQQRHHEDENYIRYTKFPTRSSSSRQQDRVRASWPRAGRSENRYLLRNQDRAPPDVESAPRDDNPDSNSAQYVFIQTFLGGASPPSSPAADSPDRVVPLAISSPPATATSTADTSGDPCSTSSVS